MSGISGKQRLMLLNEKCDTFEVEFDYYNHRAHFIILPRDKSLKINYFSLEQEARLKVVKVAKATVSHYNLQKSAILSLHFGSWISTHQIFHAHICVDVEDYLRILYEKKDEIPASKDPTGYAEEVRKDAPTYYEKDLKALEDYRESVRGRAAAGASAIRQTQLSFTAGAITGAILYHPSEPRIGFAVTNSKEPSSDELLLLYLGFAVTNSKEPSSDELLLSYLEAMIKFAVENKLTVKGGKDGCHVCLFVDEKAHGDPHGYQSFVGYIEVNVLKFYRDLCPPEKQDDWFKQFSSKGNYIVNT